MIINFSDLNYYQRVNYVFVNIQALIGIVGIVGNVLTYCVFARKRLRNASYSFYSRALVIIDSSLLVHTFRHWARFTLDFNLDLVSSFLCKIDEFLPHSAGIASLWLLTVILTDRLVTIINHNQETVFKKKWFQASLVTAVVIYSVLLHIMMPLNYRLEIISTLGNDSSSVSTNTRKICHLPHQSVQLLSSMFFANNLLNVFINGLLNIKLIIFVYERRRKITMRTNPVLVRDLKFAISSIALTITTFVTETPLGFGILTPGQLGVGIDKSQMVFAMCVTFAIVGNSASFFVNILFNSIFCEEFLNMCRPSTRSHYHIHKQHLRLLKEKPDAIKNIR